MRLKSLRQPRAIAGVAAGTGRVVRSPIVAAALSFLLPGLGQAAAGQRRRGAIIAIPTAAMLFAVAFLLLFARNRPPCKQPRQTEQHPYEIDPAHNFGRFRAG